MLIDQQGNHCFRDSRGDLRLVEDLDTGEQFFATVVEADSESAASYVPRFNDQPEEVKGYLRGGRALIGREARQKRRSEKRKAAAVASLPAEKYFCVTDTNGSTLPQYMGKVSQWLDADVAVFWRQDRSGRGWLKKLV